MRSGVAVADRRCECPGCDEAHDVVSMWHFLLVCSRWSVERELFQSNVNDMLSDISSALKARLGSNAANPDIWLRLMLGGPLHEYKIQIQNILVTQVKPATSCWRSGSI